MEEQYNQQQVNVPQPLEMQKPPMTQSQGSKAFIIWWILGALVFIGGVVVMFIQPGEGVSSIRSVYYGAAVSAIGFGFLIIALLMSAKTWRTDVIRESKILNALGWIIAAVFFALGLFTFVMLFLSR